MWAEMIADGQARPLYMADAVRTAPHARAATFGHERDAQLALQRSDRDAPALAELATPTAESAAKINLVSSPSVVSPTAKRLRPWRPSTV